MGSVHLPPELTLSVVELLDPFSCFDFAITCRTHWQQCHSAVKKHRDGFDAAGTLLVYMDDFLPPVKNILLDPKSGRYFRNLAVLQQDLSSSSPVDPLSDEDIALALERAEDFHDVYDDNLYFRPSWDSTMYLRDREVVMPILLSHMPWLRIIQIFDCQNIGSLRHDYLDSVVASYGDSCKAPRLPFQNLRTATVSPTSSNDETYPDPQWADPQWAQLFMAIPSLQNFAARNMGDVLEDTTIQHRQSGVKELLFIESRVGTPTIANILSQTHTLERFSYDLDTGHLEDANIDMKAVINSLSRYAGHSLEHLVLEAEFYGNEFDEHHLPRVSLTGLQKLKTLRCEISMIAPKDESEQFDIAAILPASLEALHLEGSWLSSSWTNLIDSLDNMYRDRTTLKSIYVMDSFYKRVFTRGDLGSDEAHRIPDISSNPLAQYTLVPTLSF